MIKVLIVDDEKIFRLGIRSCITWEEYGFTVCAEAQNGREALEKIKALNPDVVFLDIKMPGMSGLDVLDELKDQTDQMFFVVLSSINEYEYVRQAMKTGAYDYLFKPTMEPDDLVRILEEIRNKYIQEGRKPENTEEENISKFINQLFLTCDIETEVSEIAKTDPDLVNLPYYILSFSLNQSERVSAPAKKSREIIQAVLCQNLPSARIVFSEDESSENITGICFDQNLKNVHFLNQKKEFERISGYIREYLSIDVQIGVSGIGRSLADIKKVRIQSEMALERTYFRPESGVCVYHPSFEKTCDYEELYAEKMEEIVQILNKREPERAFAMIREFTDEIRGKQYENREAYCHFMANIIVTFLKKAKSGALLEKMLLENYNIISNLYHQRYVNETCEETIRVLGQACENMFGGTGEEAKAYTVEMVTGYINRNYARRISLDEIASLVHMNKNYFCKIFKEETGRSFISYLTNFRIEKATQLLTSSDQKIYEIAMSVGFQDYHHFCKTYKEYTGLSPSDVRKQGRIKED